MKLKNNLTIFIIATALMSTIYSCKKELRSKSYFMTSLGTKGVTGTLAANELENGESTLTLSMNNTLAGKGYNVHIHNGPITTPGSVDYDFGLVVPTSNTVTRTETTKYTYEELLVKDGCFVVHNPEGSSSGTYVLGGNIGKNAM